MSYFLGVDAGGTKTEFVLGDETRELARLRVGSIKRMRVSAEVAEENLRSAVEQLQSLCGISLRQVEHCRIGAAGNTVPLVTDWMKENFPRSIGGTLSIVNDVEIALDAAFPGGRGILVLAGTGSNLAARSTHGVVTTAGGWGPALADQGSGHSLGHRALRRAFLALDQSRPSRLMDDICAFWKLSDHEQLVAFANQRPATDFSRLAPLVVAAAEAEDAVALEVIEREAADLAELVLILIERLRTLEPQGFTPPQIAYTGSVITHARPLRAALIRRVSEQYPGITLLDAPADPPLGALWGARHASQKTAAL